MSVIIIGICICCWIIFIILIVAVIGIQSLNFKNYYSNVAPTSLLPSDGTSSCDLVCRIGGNDKWNATDGVPQGPCIKVINLVNDGNTYTCSEYPIEKTKQQTSLYCVCNFMNAIDWRGTLDLGK